LKTTGHIVIRTGTKWGNHPFLLPVWRSGTVCQSPSDQRRLLSFKRNLKTRYFNIAFNQLLSPTFGLRCNA